MLGTFYKKIGNIIFQPMTILRQQKKRLKLINKIADKESILEREPTMLNLQVLCRSILTW